jgi:hypothetical protein
MRRQFPSKYKLENIFRDRKVKTIIELSKHAGLLEMKNDKK